MNPEKRLALVTWARQAKVSKSALLTMLKADGLAQASRKDFLWHFILTSFSTWGNSRGYEGLIANQDNYRQVKWSAIAPLTAR